MGTRWEHPSGGSLTSFFLDGEAPTCLAEQTEPYNSQHVYMTSSVLQETTSCSIVSTTSEPSSNGDDDEKNEGMKAGYIVLIVLCCLLVIAGTMVLVKTVCMKRGMGSKGRGLINEEAS